MEKGMNTPKQLIEAAGRFRAAVLSMVKCGESWSPAMRELADDLAAAIEASTQDDWRERLDDLVLAALETVGNQLRITAGEYGELHLLNRSGKVMMTASTLPDLLENFAGALPNPPTAQPDEQVCSNDRCIDGFLGGSAVDKDCNCKGAAYSFKGFHHAKGCPARKPCPGCQPVPPSEGDAVVPEPRFVVEEYAAKKPDGTWDDGFKVCDREDGRCWPMGTIKQVAQHLADLMNALAANTPPDGYVDARLPMDVAERVKNGSLSLADHAKDSDDFAAVEAVEAAVFEACRTALEVE